MSMLTLSDTSTTDGGVKIGPGNSGGEENNFALVINGSSLVHALEPNLELLFLGVAEHCSGRLFTFLLVNKSADCFLYFQL